MGRVLVQLAAHVRHGYLRIVLLVLQRPGFDCCSIDERLEDDGYSMGPANLYSWLTRFLYYRRSKFDPLWNYVVVGGIQKGKP